MSKAQVMDRPATVRTVVYLSPENSAFVRSFPRRKRSAEVEQMIQRQREFKKKRQGFEALFQERKRLKGSSTAKEIVQWLRKERKAH